MTPVCLATRVHSPQPLPMPFLTPNLSFLPAFTHSFIPSSTTFAEHLLGARPESGAGETGKKICHSPALLEVESDSSGKEGLVISALDGCKCPEPSCEHVRWTRAPRTFPQPGEILAK